MHNPDALRRAKLSLFTVLALLVLATVACAESAPSTLNDGKGDPDAPVPAWRYAHTTNYDVRALNILWVGPDQQTQSTRPTPPTPEPTHTPETSAGTAADTTPMPTPTALPDDTLSVRYQVRCTLEEDKVCDLNAIARTLKLADENGVLYEPLMRSTNAEKLEGEVLGGGEKSGWLDYRIPNGITIVRGIAEYGNDQRVFFDLPEQASGN